MFNKFEKKFDGFIQDFDKLTLEEKEYISLKIRQKLKTVHFSSSKCFVINKSMRQILRTYGNLNEDSVVVEIGSGKFAMLSGLLWNFYGIKKYCGVDRYNIPFNDEFSLEIYKNTILDFVEISNINLEDRDALLESKWDYWKESLEVYQKDFLDIDFDDNSVDFVYSNAVFEHISNPEEVVTKMYKSMKKGGIAYHIIDLRPHGHDKSSPEPILKYNESEWRRIHPDKSYLNRLRNSEWKQLFQDIGFNILTFNEAKFENITEEVYKKIDKSFHHLSLDTLQTRQLNICLQK